MKLNKRLIANIIEIAIGAALTVLGYIGVLDNYWSGMGTALVVVGSLLLIRQIRYRTDQSYRENVDVELQDERNNYLRIKAWSWSSYLFVLIAASGSIIFRILGMDTYSIMAGSAVCLIVVLYWVSFFVLRRKY